MVGGFRVRLSGEKSDEDNDELTLAGVPAAINVADKTAAVIEFDVPKVAADTEYTFTLFVRDTWGEPSTQQRFVLRRRRDSD
jgi:chitodextrinase